MAIGEEGQDTHAQHATDSHRGHSRRTGASTVAAQVATISGASAMSGTVWDMTITGQQAALGELEAQPSRTARTQADDYTDDQPDERPCGTSTTPP